MTKNENPNKMSAKKAYAAYQTLKSSQRRSPTDSPGFQTEVSKKPELRIVRIKTDPTGFRWPVVQSTGPGVGLTRGSLITKMKTEPPQVPPGVLGERPKGPGESHPVGVTAPGE